jgi:protein-tyrosine-phosphatase
VFYFCNNKYVNSNISEIIYNDSAGFDPKKIKAVEYFKADSIEENEMKEQKDTTRELKNEIIENNDNVLQLKENEVNTKTERNNDNNNEQSIKKNNYVIQENEQQLPSITMSTKLRIISSEDYKKLTYEQLYFDKRPFCTILKQVLKTEHSLISLFLKRSLFEPIFLRFAKFVFEINMQFAFGALLYNDSYIDQRLNNSDMVIY